MPRQRGGRPGAPALSAAGWVGACWLPPVCSNPSGLFLPMSTLLYLYPTQTAPLTLTKISPYPPSYTRYLSATSVVPPLASPIPLLPFLPPFHPSTQPILCCPSSVLIPLSLCSGAFFWGSCFWHL